VIDSGGVTFNVSGTLTTVGDADFTISNRCYDFQGITASPRLIRMSLDLYPDSAASAEI
jgi:hypothetical protein